MYSLYYISTSLWWRSAVPHPRWLQRSQHLSETHLSSWHLKVRGWFWNFFLSLQLYMTNSFPALGNHQFLWAASPDSSSEENLKVKNCCGLGDFFVSCFRDFTQPQGFTGLCTVSTEQGKSGWGALAEAAARFKKIKERRERKKICASAKINQSAGSNHYCYI